MSERRYHLQLHLAWASSSPSSSSSPAVCCPSRLRAMWPRLRRWWRAWPRQSRWHHDRLGPRRNDQDLAVLCPGLHVHRHHPVRSVGYRQRCPHSGRQRPRAMPFLVANAWILASYGGVINALGRVGTGLYSDKIGRDNAYTFNCLVSAVCLFLMPRIIGIGQRLPAVSGRGHRLLAVRRRSVPDAGVHRRLLRPQKPGLQLRPGVHRLGSGLLYGQTGRHH